MNLLRIAFKHAPKQTAAVMKKINKCDMQINALVGKLSKTKPSIIKTFYSIINI